MVEYTQVQTSLRRAPASPTHDLYLLIWVVVVRISRKRMVMELEREEKVEELLYLLVFVWSPTEK